MAENFSVDDPLPVVPQDEIFEYSRVLIERGDYVATRKSMKEYISRSVVNMLIVAIIIYALA